MRIFNSRDEFYKKPFGAVKQNTNIDFAIALSRDDIKPFLSITRETAENRLSVYSSQTQPLLDFYKERGLLVSINGDQAVEKVFADIKNQLGE